MIDAGLSPEQLLADCLSKLSLEDLEAIQAILRKYSAAGLGEYCELRLARRSAENSFRGASIELAAPSWAEAWSGFGSGSPVGCCRLMSLATDDHPHDLAVWRLLAAPVSSRHVLAMQKVNGSSPFIRFQKPAGNCGFCGGRAAARNGAGRHWVLERILSGRFHRSPRKSATLRRS